MARFLKEWVRCDVCGLEVPEENGAKWTTTAHGRNVCTDDCLTAGEAASVKAATAGAAIDWAPRAPRP